MYVGGTVHIFGREMKVIDYGDQYTKNALQIENESTFAMVKPDALSNFGTHPFFLLKILKIIKKVALSQLLNKTISKFTD